MKRYNELVDAGDTDFGKRPELMAKIEQPPFYGLRMNVELGVSVSGLITNADSECLTEAGAVIPGLYAVGNNAGGLFGIDYNEVTIPGISLGGASLSAGCSGSTWRNSMLVLIGILIKATTA